MAAVQISGASKSFVAGKPVLRNIDLSIDEGEMVGLIGASGSGKSTLIRLTCGLECVDRDGAAELRLFDRVTQRGGRRTREVRALRRDVGVIFQQFNLVSRLSLMRNVLTGRLGRIPAWRGTLGVFPRSDKIKALQALERVGMVDFAHQRASTLSGGQQQRGAIARALTQEAKLILADEPIASLDPASAEHVMAALSEINREDGTTVVVSLHQIDFAFSHCSRLVALQDGTIVYDGATTGISRQDLVALYGVDSTALGKDGNGIGKRAASASDAVTSAHRTREKAVLAEGGAMS